MQSMPGSVDEAAPESSKALNEASLEKKSAQEAKIEDQNGAEASAPNADANEESDPQSKVVAQKVDDVKPSQTEADSESGAISTAEMPISKGTKEPATPKVEEEKGDDASEHQVSVSMETVADSPEEIAEAAKSEDDTQEEEQFDFDHAGKKELLSKLKEVRNEEDFKRLDKILRALKPRFDELFELEKNEALQKFVSEGNDAAAFAYHSDEQDKEFIALFGQLKSRRNKHFKELQNQRDENLKTKERLLDQLREIVDGEESTESINEVREIQSAWKKVGAVPGAHTKTLWASYNALLDRFYDARSIYFELKDLDRKKNMEQKLELCEKAEALATEKELKTAIVHLNDLHEEYKHIGPVPKDDQEPLWQRFKAASDAIYQRRKEEYEELKEEFKENLVKKKELISEVEAYLSFGSDRITEWNAKTKEILDIQKRWESIGGVPREQAKEVNRAFWNAFKKFFAQKGSFFKTLEGQRDDNLEKKQALIERADELKESTDWETAAQKFKQLQAEWKEIGPVPDKVSKETYAAFKKACDTFFDRRRDQNKEKFKEYDENLDLKMQICDQLEAAAAKEEIDLDEVYELIDNYTAIGFVPKNAIKKSRKRFEVSVQTLLDAKALQEEERSALANHIEFGRLRNLPGGDRKIQRAENQIRRKISNLENDISTWNTNIEFFANSATADKLKADMQKQISAAENELKALRVQLRSL